MTMDAVLIAPAADDLYPAAPAAHRKRPPPPPPAFQRRSHDRRPKSGWGGPGEGGGVRSSGAGPRGLRRTEATEYDLMRPSLPSPRQPPSRFTLCARMLRPGQPPPPWPSRRPGLEGVPSRSDPPRQPTTALQPFCACGLGTGLGALRPALSAARLDARAGPADARATRPTRARSVRRAPGLFRRAPHARPVPPGRVRNPPHTRPHPL